MQPFKGEYIEMKKTLILFALIFLSAADIILLSKSSIKDVETDNAMFEATYYNLYDKLSLDGKLSREAFDYAIDGYRKIEKEKSNILTVVDFSQPSTNKRMFIIDLDKQELLFSTYVSHGKNSGGKYATSFSNRNGSNKSSLGFYLTGKTYKGRNGYSLALNGLEKGINDKARERAIVVHGASYCNPSIVEHGGTLGRSFGCLAIPTSITRQIIDTIKDGSLIFVYAENKHYLTESKIINNNQHNTAAL